jgi:hypothetical protein
MFQIIICIIDACWGTCILDQLNIHLNKKLKILHHFPIPIMSQPHFGQVWGWNPTLGKVGELESFGTPECSELDSKGQNTSHWGVLSSLERSWNIDIENALAFSIWTSVAQVMGKRRAGSQTGSLTPDH